MKNYETLGLIGGGQMGEAIIRGLLAADSIAADKVMVMEPDAERCAYLVQQYGIQAAENETDLAEFSSVLLLAVKPQVTGSVLELYKPLLTVRHLLISIAAGITINSMEEMVGSHIKIIRVMPNTPALVLAGASALSPNLKAEREDVETAMSIFTAVGTCVEVNEELLDAVTGLSGSGPGYVFSFIEAMVDGGVLAGLPRAVAEKLVLQTVYGSAKLAMETGESPAVLKGRVTSPGGTTITGLQVLEESGMRGAVMTAIESATERSKELGQ